MSWFYSLVNQNSSVDIDDMKNGLEALYFFVSLIFFL